MVADLPGYIIEGTPINVKSNMTCYADDSSLYASSKCCDTLKQELERKSDKLLSFCKEVGLVLNADKTQMLVSGIKSEDFSVKVGNSHIKPSNELKLLGVTYDSNFSTAPYLRQLASESKARAALIARLSYSVPPHVLKMLTNGLLVGKIMAAAPAAIPLRINHDDKGSITLTNKINLALKSAARTITRTRLSDRIRSENVMQKAGLRELNEMVASASAMMVWKSKQLMDPLGSILFPTQSVPIDKMCLRSANSGKAKLPVPGYGNLAANLLARTWNQAPELQSAITLGAAKTAARKWAQTIQLNG